MRIHIIQEDVKDNIGRLFLPGSIKMDHRQVPVYFGIDGDIVGFAQDLERDDKLNVSVDITFRKDFLEKYNFVKTNEKITDWFSFSASSRFIEYEDAPRDVVKSATVRGIHAILVPGFPKHMSDRLVKESEAWGAARAYAGVDSPNAMRSAAGLPNSVTPRPRAIMVADENEKSLALAHGWDRRDILFPSRRQLEGRRYSLITITWSAIGQMTDDILVLLAANSVSMSAETKIDTISHTTPN